MGMDLPHLATLRIVYYPDPVLKRICAPVDRFGPDLQALAERMLLLLREAKGVGLAAPQVGLAIRLFVCNATGDPADDLICVNPQLSDLSGAEEGEEGCLSIPGVTVTMRRAQGAVINAHDTGGCPFQKTGDSLRARIWQHELDHLDGRLIIDNMSPTDEITNRRALKQLQDTFALSNRGKKQR